MTRSCLLPVCLGFWLIACFGGPAQWVHDQQAHAADTDHVSVHVGGSGLHGCAGPVPLDHELPVERKTPSPDHSDDCPTCDQLTHFNSILPEDAAGGWLPLRATVSVLPSVIEVLDDRHTRFPPGRGPPTRRG